MFVTRRKVLSTLTQGSVTRVREALLRRPRNSVTRCSQSLGIKKNGGKPQVSTCKNYKMRPFRSFRELSMWTQHFSSRLVHANVQRMSCPASCVSQPYPVESISSRALRLWVFLATMFTGLESLRLFPLGLRQRLFVPHQPAHCSGGASGN